MNTYTSGNINFVFTYSCDQNTYTSMPTDNKVIYIQHSEY